MLSVVQFFVLKNYTFFNNVEVIYIYIPFGILIKNNTNNRIQLPYLNIL